MLQALGLRLLIVEDEAATATTLSSREPVDARQQRFGNTCNSKPQPRIKDRSSAKIPAPPPPPVSRAHLRVIQGKRRGGKYG